MIGQSAPRPLSPLPVVLMVALAVLTPPAARAVDYLDQTPPGETPEVFAPGLVSTEAWEAAGSFTPDGSEFFFTRRATHEGTQNRVMHMRRGGDGWTAPELASFAVDQVEYEPHVTPDGRRIYFNSRRPDPGSGRADRQVWYAEPTETGWSEAKPASQEINRLSPMYVSATRDGSLFFGALEGRRYGIWRAQRKGEGFAAPEYLPEAVNGLSGASHPYIAPDESYLIFDAYTEGPGESALYLSVKDEQGNWRPAVRLGEEINATKTEIAPSVSPDGRFLFFHRRGDIYWVSLNVLEKSGLPKR